MTYKLLLVDDDDIILRILKKMVSNIASLETVTFHSAAEAIEYIRSSKVHIIISDIIMEEMDGLDFLKIVKEIDPLCHIIMMTSDKDFGKILLSLGMGALDFIHKPVKDSWEVRRLVSDSLRRWRRWYKVLKNAAEHSKEYMEEH